MVRDSSTTCSNQFYLDGFWLSKYPAKKLFTNGVIDERNRFDGQVVSQFDRYIEEKVRQIHG